VDYPSEEEEKQIVKTTTAPRNLELKKVLSPERILSLQELVLKVPASDHIVEYAVRLVRRTRPGDPLSPKIVKEWVQWGAGPRGSQYLILGGKARTILEGRYAVTTEDIRALAKPVLRHRLIPTFHAEAEGVTSLTVIDRLLAEE